MATVLIVDDEPIVREVVVRYLVRDGHTTLEADDGERARVLLEQQTPDLVVLDVMLPGVDGLELCRWTRSGSCFVDCTGQQVCVTPWPTVERRRAPLR